MKRSIIVASCIFVGAFVACAELFDEPSQCKSDRDCTKFGGVCNITQSVCVAAPIVPGGEGGSEDASNDAAEEASPPPPPGCEATSKDTSEIPSTPLATTGESELDANVTLDCTKDWILKDRTFVKTGVTLTIQPGTRVLALGNAGLIVRPGAKIEAKGFSDQPIVFAASVPGAGAWRGLFVLGAAPPTNAAGFGNDAALAYGGTTAADSSGTLEFVRIEHSTSGVVFGGVGSGTKIDSIQVRRSNDNCFVFAGGRVNAKHLVCQYPADEMFEFSGGYDGKLQYLFGQKAPTGGGHNGLLIDSNTFPKISNITICGEANGNTSVGFQFRNNARFEVANGIVSGWGVGFDYSANAGTNPNNPITLRNTRVADNGTNPAFVEVEGGTPADNDNGFDEIAWFEDGGSNSTNSAGLAACHDGMNPQPWPNAQINGATPPNDGFFDTSANYVGAFKDATDGWISGKWIKRTDP